jgi:hypothetical protein
MSTDDFQQTDDEIESPPPPPQPARSARPDAIRLPPTARLPVKTQGVSTIFERVGAVADIAEPLLQVDKTKGERAYIRRMPTGDFLFITRDPNDTIKFPIGHPLGGRDRYTWEDHGDGVSLGYLVDT